MSADGRRYKKGDRYQVTEDFTGHVLTMWKAPFTGGYEKVIPAGLKFVIAFDAPASASAVAADAEPMSEWEELLVAADDRANPKYNGYYLTIPFEHVEKQSSAQFDLGRSTIAGMYTASASPDLAEPHPVWSRKSFDRFGRSACSQSRKLSANSF